MAETESQGITRRDLLKRGAALGGAVVWATPIVQTLGMGRAYAQTASPPDISYIALVLACDGVPTWFVKWEDGGGWENDPGAMQECSATLTLGGAVSANGGDLGLDMQDAGGGCYNLVLVGSNPCTSGELTVQAGVVKGGQECQSAGSGALPLGPICLS
ncbi:MAG: twin-arginine translocation signal domain-containing protein [Acidimicrobiia bacterium]|nr:twin-arginine translocation signal domain-containing protein [Acidimicrobiia bacterium]